LVSCPWNSGDYQKSASSLKKKESYRQFWGASQGQFTAGGIGDGLEIAGVPVAERTRLLADSGKPEDPQYTEIAQKLENFTSQVVY
jgi:hypothetical protein